MILFFIATTIVVIFVAAKASGNGRYISSNNSDSKNIEDIARIEKARFLNDCIKSIKGG